MLIYKNPSLSHEVDLLAYRREILRYKESFDGSAGLGSFTTITAWLERLFALEPIRAKTYGYYPTVVYLAYHDNTLAGIVNIRLSDEELLRNTAGHIGYNVRPTMRHRGIAREMLLYAVEVCHANGILCPVVCTEHDNIASQRTALSCGFLKDGTMEVDTGEIICRFVSPL